ncbi:MAG: hypothetical protein KKC75_00380, partial [Nanoarchaeota archaeon]|nr:hypothetical protein [Nanoarchaeota archaeon]MBU1945952.1 hypothetical protein [Nanoarchaeota archaeon]
MPKPTIQDMQRLAKAKGGECLSKKYVNANTHLMWKCKDKHIWEATPSTLKSGHWCRLCSFN